MRAILGDAHVAGGDAAHRAFFIVKHLGRGEARIDLDAERLGLRRQPAADIAERADIAMMIVHQRRHRDGRQRDRGAGGHPVELVDLDLRLQRTVGVLAPIRKQLVERHRIDHRAGQDVRADFRPLLHHDDRQIGIELLQPDRGGEAGRPGADDHDVEFHGFARRQFFGAHDLISARLRTRLRPFVSDFCIEEQPWKCAGQAFRCGAIRSRMTRMPLRRRAMTPDPAPSVQQLLAFYLEAGVDCALTDEPVNRLSDPDIVPISGSRETRTAQTGQDDRLPRSRPRAARPRLRRRRRSCRHGKRREPRLRSRRCAR